MHCNKLKREGDLESCALHAAWAGGQHPVIHLYQTNRGTSMNAAAAAQLARRRGEAYEACLHRRLDARARFIALWLSSDERFEGAAWKELVTIAVKHALPRSAPSWQRQPGLRNDPP